PIRPTPKRPASSGRGPPTSGLRWEGSARRRRRNPPPAPSARREPPPPLPAPRDRQGLLQGSRLPRRPPWMCAPCCTAASARSGGPRSCAPQRSRCRATRSASSSKKSATSLPSPSSPAPSRALASRWRQAWLVGLVVTLGLLAWALHGVDARALIAHLRRANPSLMVATIALATLTFPLRAVRWRLILRGASGSP